jgi:acyl-CoA thioesterase-1
MRSWLKCGALVLLCWAQGALAGTVLVVGDSISAAFGLETSQGWVHLLQERLREEGKEWRVVNASISGDTTAGGLARLDPLLKEHAPEVVILELGGNDGLRGQSPAQLKQNLAEMIDRSRDAGAEVLLLGMRMPPNLGQRYTRAFADAFDSLAAEKPVAYVPFLLEGVGGVAGMMQADGIHPTAEAQTQLLETVWPALEPLL